ncbi:MAG: HDOD domain-containing protein [candidate division FCPU426 bacterium]
MLGPIKPSEIQSLAPLPLSVVRLAELVSDPNSETDAFVGVIKFDQALTANVLRWANSAWSQSRTPIENVRDAVIRLGSENILKLAIGYHLMKPMKQGNRGYSLTENELWRHSVAAALAAESLSHFAKVPIPPAAFTGALIHDIGKLVLGRHLGTDNLKDAIQHAMEDKNLTYIQAEREITGTDHAEVGAAIAREWKIPEPLVKAIAFHHEPEREPDVVLDAVHIGNAVAKLVGQGLGTEQYRMEVSGHSAERLGLTEEAIQALCAEVVVSLEKTEKQWETR